MTDVDILDVECLGNLDVDCVDATTRWMAA